MLKLGVWMAKFMKTKLIIDNNTGNTVNPPIKAPNINIEGII